MKTNASNCLCVLLLVLLGYHSSLAQSKKIKQYLNAQNEKYMKEFPPVLKDPYPEGSLGNKLQQLYKAQAEDGCGIRRSDPRLFIPRELINGYGEIRLRNTSVYDIPFSATNLLFLTLNSSDEKKLNSGSLIETDYVNAKRIVGQKNDLVNYGQSVLNPIPGFPSLYFQKSCGSYFVGDLDTQVKAPVAELETSLKAETKKSTSITTVTGKFFSPLYLIFGQNTVQSVYAHLLLWEVYYEDYKNAKDPSDLLIRTGKYISEMDATLVHRANSSDQSLNMNARLAANFALGVFSATGSIQAGQENKSTFSLVDFNTSIHKLSDGKLSYALTELPKAIEIAQKLQNSLNYKPQPSFNGYITHLVPVQISRILTGVPGFLCDRDSWQVRNDFNKDIWVSKPEVASVFNAGEKGNYPDCICKVTGFVKKTAIDKAISDKGTIEIKLNLVNNMEVSGEKLVLSITEPSLKVTDAPKILPLNSDIINAGRQVIGTNTSTAYNFPIQLIIDETGISLTKPYRISNLQVEYVNADQAAQKLKFVGGINITGNMVSVVVSTEEKPKEFIAQGNDLSVPIKLKFSIELLGGALTQLVTSTVNLNVPNLVTPPLIETKIAAHAQ